MKNYTMRCCAMNHFLECWGSQNVLLFVTKDDPNFKALEADMEERKQSRLKDTEKAQLHKIQKINDFQKQLTKF